MIGNTGTVRNLSLLLCSLVFLSAGKDEANKSFDCKSFEKSLCFIPKGILIFQDSSEISDYKIPEKTFEIDSFYMCNHTVTNKEYGIFLEDLSQGNASGKDSGSPVYAKMLPDTLVWMKKKAFGDDMIKYYFRHPSYQDYPVVGVSHEQAEYYCKWLTAKYNKDPKRKFKNALFKLPSIYQWEYAAHGGLLLSPFPWKRPDLRNSEGSPMANFMSIPEQTIKREDDTGKLEFTYSRWMNEIENDLTFAGNITVPVLSFWPNDYGLYNMAGNVAEYVKEIGITKGGGWYDPGYYLQIWAQGHYKDAHSASDEMGFRVAMEIK